MRVCVQTTSGLQGVISQKESEVETKLRKVCETAKMYEDAAERSMTTMTNIYNMKRRAIIHRYMSEQNFVEHAERLSGNLTSLWKRSSSLLQQLDEMHHDVQRQIEDLYRTEVDVDMKLRACHGSCQSTLQFSVDHKTHQTLQSDLDQMDETHNLRRKAAMSPKDVPHIKLEPVDVGPALFPEYKTIPAVKRELLTQFEDIEQNQVVLEQLLDE